MLQQYHTKLKGTLALTDSYLTEKALQKEKGLYKFIWVRNGSITVEIDHQEMILKNFDTDCPPAENSAQCRPDPGPERRAHCPAGDS